MEGNQACHHSPESWGQESKMSNIVKYRIVLADNQGSFAIDGLASAVKGARWFGTVDSTLR